MVTSFRDKKLHVESFINGTRTNGLCSWPVRHRRRQRREEIMSFEMSKEIIISASLPSRIKRDSPKKSCILKPQWTIDLVDLNGHVAFFLSSGCKILL